jgi:hypothetical protein
LGNNTISNFPGTAFDATLNQVIPENNYGVSPTLEVNREQEQELRHFLIKFDLDVLRPYVVAGKWLREVRLYLKTTSQIPAGTTISAYRVATQWNEGTKDDAAATDNDVTWDWRDYDDIDPFPSKHKWYLWGALRSNLDFVPRVDADMVTVTEANTWYSWDVTAAIGEQYDLGTSFGLIVRYPVYGGNDQFGETIFHSSDAIVADDRPYLHVIAYPSSSSSSTFGTTIEDFEIIESVSSSSSSFSTAATTGDVVWGQVSGADETYQLPFDTNWVTTDGDIESTGNPERLITYNGGISESEVWNLGTGPARIILNKYQEGEE